MRPKYFRDPFMGDSLPGTLHRTLMSGRGCTLYLAIKSLAMAGSTNPSDVSSDFLALEEASAVESFLGEFELALSSVSLFFSGVFSTDFLLLLLLLIILFRFLLNLDDVDDFGARVILLRFSLNNDPSSCIADGRKPRFVAIDADGLVDDFDDDINCTLFSARLSANRCACSTSSPDPDPSDADEMCSSFAPSRLESK